MTEQNILLQDGLYQLGNHPDGNAASPEYGLRLDGILTGNPDDIVTFDFEHPDADVKIQVAGSQVRIFGTAFGGIDLGESYDPHNSGLWQIDFTYNNVEGLQGDDDVIVDRANAGGNTGTIKQLFGDQLTFDLNDYAGNKAISFQLGNEADDQGHRGFNGISGWGWLNHSNFDGYAAASDWLFTVNPEPLNLGENNPPVAVDDFATTSEGVKVGIRVLDNDSDPDGDTINLKSFTQASNGIVKLNRNGTPDDLSDDRLVYHPDAGFTGVDTFTYAIDDGNGGMDMATVTVTVNPANNPPIAVDDFATTSEGVKVGIRVLDNDSDPDGDTINLKSFTQASNGVVRRNNNGTIGDRSDDRLVYDPNDGFTGVDTFTYAIDDGNGGMDMVTVTVTVNPANNPPVAVDDFATTSEGVKVGIRVLDNDSDPDGDTINLKSFTQASNGIVRRNNNGTIGDRSDDRLVYHPDAGFSGTDTFTYAIDDGNGGMDMATVTVTVDPVNPPDNGVTYELCNHPDGAVSAPFYGLRLDGLLTGDAHDIVTFDFEDAQSDMRINIQDDSIRIFGVAYGGLDIGEEYDPHNSGLWKIDFTYNNVTGLDGDDDLIVERNLAGTNTGEITQLYGDGASFDLTDYAGAHPMTFQLGDGVDDLGYRGFSGISGWGWVNHSGGEGHLAASDWLFTVKAEENIGDREFAVDVEF